jgi:putative flippase GtrA
VSMVTGTLRRVRLTGLWRRFEHLVAELVKFGAVGGAAAVVDIALSNLLRFGIGLGPLTSKTLSVAAAATIAFLGNRYWTWRHRARSNLAKEYFLYFVLNAVGLLIALLVVGFTFYVLGLHGPLAYNISANIVGLGLGTLFRFWSYKKWVFLPPDLPAVDPHTGLPIPENGAAHEADATTSAANGAAHVAHNGSRAPDGNHNGRPLTDRSREGVPGRTLPDVPPDSPEATGSRGRRASDP